MVVANQRMLRDSGLVGSQRWVQRSRVLSRDKGFLDGSLNLSYRILDAGSGEITVLKQRGEKW